MEFYELNRTVGKYKPGTLVAVRDKLPFGYKGSVTCDVIGPGKRKEIQVGRSRLRFVFDFPSFRFSF